MWRGGGVEGLNYKEIVQGGQGSGACQIYGQLQVMMFLTIIMYKLALMLHIVCVLNSAVETTVDTCTDKLAVLVV